MRILFQGDSITDAGRDRADYHEMGEGYPKYSKELLMKLWPDAEYINLGISGDRTCDLMARWQEDCIKLQPDFISILIGINDTWRAYDSNSVTTVEQFEANYRSLLEDIKANTNAKILILEPFLLDSDKNKYCFRDDLNPKIDVVRRLAREYADAFIPLDGLFAAACINNAPSYFSDDGVHPNANGSKFIARLYAEAAANM